MCLHWTDNITTFLACGSLAWFFLWKRHMNGNKFQAECNKRSSAQTQYSQKTQCQYTSLQPTAAKLNISSFSHNGMIGRRGIDLKYLVCWNEEFAHSENAQLCTVTVTVTGNPWIIDWMGHNFKRPATKAGELVFEVHLQVIQWSLRCVHFIFNAITLKLSSTDVSHYAVARKLILQRLFLHFHSRLFGTNHVELEN